MDIYSTKNIVWKLEMMMYVCVYLHGIKRSDGDDDSGAANSLLAVGLQCFNKRFLYSGLNILLNFFDNKNFFVLIYILCGFP